jgi:hypothetical protein
MKLGNEVICNAHLKKVKIKYVVAEENEKKWIEENTHFNDFAPKRNQEFILLNTENEYLYQTTKEVIAKEFKGIVVAKKNISTKNYYEFAQFPIYDSESLGFIDMETDYMQVRVSKDEYVECYQVFYGMGKSRLVPIENIILDKENKL